MRIHSNAKTTPVSRAAMIARRNEGWTVGMIAAAHDVSEATVYKWIHRFGEEGKAGLVDRTSRPHRFRRPVAQGRICEIIALRQRRLTGWQIAHTLRMPRSTVAAVLQRVGLARLSLLEPPKPLPRRYQRERPGELVHLDVKPLGRIGVVGHRIHGDKHIRARGVGWEFVHVAVDDASRLAFAEILPDQKGITAVGFFDQMHSELPEHLQDSIQTGLLCCYRPTFPIRWEVLLEPPQNS